MDLNDIATKKDLKEFKREILEELKQIRHTEGAQNKKYLRSSDVRKMFNISAGTLQNLRIRGNIPYSKLGTTLVYDLDEIIEYFNKGKARK